MEYFEYDSDEISIYKSGQLEPVFVFDQIAYFLDRQDELDAIEDTQSPIMSRWYKPLWSPDGRYLAIVGAIEGPSSDLYVFDTQTQRFQRLTS